MNNFFALFHLPQDYAIDLTALEKTYQALAVQYHPDRVAALSAFHQKENMMMAAAINQAYGVLRDDIERAVHLLALRGIDANARENNLTDPEFLMQQMEWREALEDAENINQINQLKQDIQQVTQTTKAQLSAELTHQDDIAAVQAVQRLRFMHKLSAAIDEKIAQMA